MIAYLADLAYRTVVPLVQYAAGRAHRAKRKRAR